MQNKTFYNFNECKYTKLIDTGKRVYPCVTSYKLQVANSKFIHKNNLQPDEII